MDDTEAKNSRLRQFVSSPEKGLWTLAWPMMAGMGIQTLYILADMLFVGKAGASELTALTFNIPIQFFVIGLVFGLGNGVTAVVAQHVGAGDKKNADRSAEHAVALGAVLSVVLTLATLAWGKPCLAALGVPDEVMEDAWQYLRISAFGFTFLVMVVFFRSVLAGEGDMKTPTMIQGAETLLNIALDPVFIFTLDLGVEGAAIATVICEGLVALAYVYLLFFKDHAYVTFDLADFKFHGAILRRIFEIGLPSSFGFLVMASSGAFFNWLLSSFSGQAVAAFQVGRALDQIFLLPTLSISAAVMTLAGMFYGAGRHDLTRSIVAYAMSRAAAIGVVIATLFFVFAPELISIFTQEPEIRRIGTTHLRWAVFAYPFIVVFNVSGKCLQGLGQGLPIAVLSTLRVFAVSAPLSMVFVHVMDRPIEWVWAAIVAGPVVTSAVGLMWMLRGLNSPDRRLPAPRVRDSASRIRISNEEVPHPGGVDL